ncbi:MAG: helix-turn-helix domain-containing protein [Desulfobulbaceae bacterium]|nr:helix-turn-helix domain-containing protein [Desulfobulbaceae bacterium]HIJ91587.1 helix-turn-helix domain-containing protein [Deltaproteobacteria bacterium]
MIPAGHAIDPAVIAPAWRSLQEALPVRLAPIRTEAQLEEVVALLHSLIDAVGDDEGHELADFLDLVGQLVEDYETQHHPVPEAEPRAVLRFFMEQHGLKQTDLSEEIGGQSVVSEILTGKREINARQAKALAARFRVSPAVFI